MMFNRNFLVLSLLSLSCVFSSSSVLANVSNISIISENSLSWENQAMQYEVSDVMGKVIYTSSMNSGKSTIDASAWSNGVYTLTLNDGTTVYQTRIIKN